jgi:uncharacterized protein YndB with AHSA1/START domain
MTWLWIVIGVLVALPLLMAVIGSFLPRAHTASRTIALPLPPADVWRLLVDRASQPAWRGDLKSVESRPSVDGRSRFVETTRQGAVLYEVDLEEPPTRLRTRIADETLPYCGHWLYELSPEGGGTKLTITENGEVKNPIFRFLSRFVFSHGATIEGFLAALRKRTE